MKEALEDAELSASLYAARSYLGACKVHADRERFLLVSACIVTAMEDVNEAIESLKKYDTEIPGPN